MHLTFLSSLVNLLSNAFKFTKQGHVRLVCRMLDFTPPPEVADLGLGRLEGIFSTPVHKEGVATASVRGGTVRGEQSSSAQPSPRTHHAKFGLLEVVVADTGIG